MTTTMTMMNMKDITTMNMSMNMKKDITITIMNTSMKVEKLKNMESVHLCIIVANLLTLLALMNSLLLNGQRTLYAVKVYAGLRTNLLHATYLNRPENK